MLAEARTSECPSPSKSSEDASDVLDILHIFLRLSTRPVQGIAARVFGALDIPPDVAAGVELDGPCCCSGRKGSEGEDGRNLHVEEIEMVKVKFVRLFD